MTDRKAVIKNADMSEDMQQDAGTRFNRWCISKTLSVFLVDIATQALEKYNIEKDIAAYIKKEFDKKYNPTWHWYAKISKIENNWFFLICLFSLVLSVVILVHM